MGHRIISKIYQNYISQNPKSRSQRTSISSLDLTIAGLKDNVHKHSQENATLQGAVTLCYVYTNMNIRRH